MRRLGYRLPEWAIKECYRLALMSRIKESVEKAKTNQDEKSN